MTIERTGAVPAHNDPGLFWSQLGEKLGISSVEMQSLCAAFGRLAQIADGIAWPEQVLARMEMAPAQTSLAFSAPPIPMDVPLAADMVINQDEQSCASIREMILDLRREIRCLSASERADILRLDQGVRKLSLEVRDLRYALMLAFSRRDRKRGKKGISNLLLG